MAFASAWWTDEPKPSPEECPEHVSSAVGVAPDGPVAAFAGLGVSRTLQRGGHPRAFAIVSPPLMDRFMLNFDGIEVAFSADTATAQRWACAMSRPATAHDSG